MEEKPKTKYNKFTRIFVDVDKFENARQTRQVPEDGVSFSEKLEYAGKVLFAITLVIFLVPFALVFLGVGGPEFIQVGFVIPMVMFPFLVILGIALAFSRTFKKTNSSLPNDSSNQS